MEIAVFETKAEAGRAAAKQVASLIRAAIEERGKAHIILATGASQFEMLATLVALDVDWSKVTAFHLDEYIGLPMSHPASFRKYLKERFQDRVAGLEQFHLVDGENPDPLAECARLDVLIRDVTIDVACVGIGENGHLAFNDPPADWTTDEPYLVVNLDEACRRQQLGEGWFATLDEVPTQAISMSIRQIMKSPVVVCTVPDRRKAVAVKNTIQGPVTNLVPASILQQHPHCHMYLDKPAASLLT
jgi:glucosamine-6-phosphate deaminase